MWWAVLVLPGAYASSVAVTLDMLAASARLAGGVPAEPPAWGVYSPAGGQVLLQGGLNIPTSALSTIGPDRPDVVIIPGLGLTGVDHIRQRLALEDAVQSAAFLRDHAADGGHIAASCSAVFLLQAAGLLTGRRVTTTWWLAPLLRALECRCEVDADSMICVDGQITTAGAAMAQTDLMLHLLREHVGAELAESVSSMMLVESRSRQAPFIAPEAIRGSDDLIGHMVDRISASLPDPPSVAQLARDLNMSERTLSRHVHRATGKSTISLIHSVRLRTARRLLADRRMSVDQVARAVGYQDTTALRRLMKKDTGSPPSHFRAAPGPRQGEHR